MSVWTARPFARPRHFAWTSCCPRAVRAPSRRTRGWTLPKPIVNDYVEALEADFVFTAQRVLVETDSWQHHKSRDSFESDRRRDAVHTAAGWRTLRFTHPQIASEPATVRRAPRAAPGTPPATARPPPPPPRAAPAPPPASAAPPAPAARAGPRSAPPARRRSRTPRSPRA